MASNSLNTNLAEMGYCRNLSFQLNSSPCRGIFFSLLENSGKIKKSNVDRYMKQKDPIESCLLDLGNLGYTIKDLLYLLAEVKLDKPQLALKRKFEPVKIKKITCSRSDTATRLKCIASGFPSPNFQWFRDGELLPETSESQINISSCCADPGTYHCEVWNEIGEGEEWSEFYRRNGKQFSSRTTSKPFKMEAPHPDREYCSRCAQEKILERLSGIFTGELDSKDQHSIPEDGDEYDGEIATDKVALIISNAQYHHLPSLLTPPCDAEVLAVELMRQDFKTVTLSDLTLAEMKTVIFEYKKLLGKGVYAVFYFVGHGFEAHGKCFVIPVDAPAGQYSTKDCLAIDWVLNEMQDTSPALNLILLDMCRKIPPQDSLNYVESFSDKKPAGNRNTVFGYATSCGVGAYEIKGEGNGVFMKYLKNHVGANCPIEDMLRKVMRDLEEDDKAGEVQFPEFRSNLSRIRKLTDPLRYQGHTESFDDRTMGWRLIHEFPDPTHVNFEEQHLKVLIWFDFFGHFTNMVYVFTSVTDPDSQGEDQSEYAKEHTSFLKFEGDVHSIQTTVCNDTTEGISVRTLLRNLQKVKGSLIASVDLRRTADDTVLATKTVDLGGVLITRIGLQIENSGDQSEDASHESG